jgi:MoaA/NifB/PqqE/SkfB family radical SAM enzyme
MSTIRWGRSYHITDLLRPFDAPQSIPDLSFLWLEITAKCNLECNHCYADSSPREDMFGLMKLEDWLTVLRDAAELGCRQVQFIGGEPTLHPDLPRMIAFASSIGYSMIEVFTNCTVMNASLIDTFVKHSVHIAISFYSDDSKTHDSITNRHGSFERTLANVRRLVASKLPIRAGIIETPNNPAHSERAKRLLASNGVSDIRIDQQRKMGRAAQDLHQLDPMKELCGECWKGKLCITPSGQAYPCVFSRFAHIGNVKAGGIQNILYDIRLARFRMRQMNQQMEADKRAEGGLHRSSCGPDVVCNPDLSCSPNCAPGSSSCGPTQFCVPSRGCAPDLWCTPSASPCEPVTRVANVSTSTRAS